MGVLYVIVNRPWLTVVGHGRARGRPRVATAVTTVVWPRSVAAAVTAAAVVVTTVTDRGQWPRAVAAVSTYDARDTRTDRGCGRGQWPRSLTAASGRGH